MMKVKPILIIVGIDLELKNGKMNNITPTLIKISRK